MTSPKVATIKRGGSRFYIHPKTQAKVPGVTSVVGMLPKEFYEDFEGPTAEVSISDGEDADDV